MTIKLITHDRVVHADDAMAAAILRMVFREVTVQRTRDPAILRSEAGKPDVFLLDIGGRYAPEERLFDHHQPEGAGFRKPESCEWPYATAGLVWKHFGAEAVRLLHPTLADESITETVAYIDDAVIRYIDAVDCGVRVKTSGPSLSSLIASFNPSWYENEDEVFPLVMDLSQVVLTNFIKRYAGKVLARETVRSAQLLHGGQVMLLDACLPWVTVVAEEFPTVLFVVYPVGSGAARQWQLRAAPNEDMTPRIKLPASWAGRERGALAAVTDEPTSLFCHRSRHLAGATSFEGALTLVSRAIALHEQESLAQAA